MGRPSLESAVDHFDGLDEILGDYANTGKQITGDESTWKQMLVHVVTSFTADDLSFGKFKEVEVEGDTESEEEESDTEGNDTSGSDSEDLDYDPKHDDVFDDDEHIVEEVHVNINNFSFTADPKHDTSICVVDVQENDLDVINYDSFGSDLDDGIDYERRIQLRKLRRIDKQKNKGPNKYYFYLGQQFASPWLGQILTTVGVDANNRIYPVAYAIVEAESKVSWCWFLNLLGEDLDIEANFNYTFISDRQKFKGCVYKEMLWNAAKATSEGEFKKKIVGVVIPKQWVHATYRLETWAHVYSFKANPYNGRDMLPVVESRTVIIPPLYKPPVGRPPKKRKKSNDEIASQSASSSKLSRKGKLVSCGKCGNVSHNRKGCKGQGGSFSQAGARKVSG
ncbi:mutator type transposase [Tanacetum coccineum]